MFSVRLLLPVAVVLVLQNPAPSAREASSKPKQPAHQIQKQAKDKGDAPDNGMTVNIFSGTPDSEDHTTNSQTGENAKSSTDRWLAIFTAALVGVGALQAAILFFQLRWMKRNTNALIHMQRSRIAIGLETKYDTGRVCVFYNYGQTPARIIYAFVSLKTIGSIAELPKVPEYGENVLLADQVCIPKDEPSVLKEFDYVAGTTDWATVRAGTRSLIYFGVVRYFDMFDAKTERQTAFCYLYVFGKGFVVSGPPEYNKVN